MTKEANKETAKTVVATTTKIAKTTEKKEILSDKKIYIGPGKPGLITNTVYNGGYPLYVVEMIEKCPEIGKLMVDIKEYQVAAQKIKENGTLENAYAKKVLAFFKEDK